MFTKDEKNSSESETIIGPSVQVEGNFNGEGNIIVEGQVSGSLKTKGDLRIGTNAKIKADIEARNIFNAGEIRGSTVIAKDKIELTKTAKVNSNVKASVISIEAGAIINGKVNMSQEAAEESQPLELQDKKEKNNRK
ncbi:polymer-forming cytoskeletal protein [Patescibacteria group bacterium]|nr:polymer-forming cytoskeletal protein [Patescibacteria group bacterium]MBU1890276.1 polymer-forming cytoskeletal protein [Patescibacteria group bacterium]